jgi:hypothetical protein
VRWPQGTRRRVTGFGSERGWRHTLGAERGWKERQLP